MRANSGNQIRLTFDEAFDFAPSGRRTAAGRLIVRP